jgi:S-formylglutathione hydrolase FrmB
MRMEFRTFKQSSPAFSPEGLTFVTVKSPALGARGEVVLFASERALAEKSPPLVTLLHGVYNGAWAWALLAGAHVTLKRLEDAGEVMPMVLAMPSDGAWGDGTIYARHRMGRDYERWIVDEVPAVAERAFPQLGLDQSPRFLGGLSMGGFGTLRLGGLYPRRWKGLSAHSACTQLSDLVPYVEEDPMALGIEPATAWEALVAAGPDLPPLRMDCGRDDILLEANRALHEKLKALGVAHSYEEYPGPHEWPYWIENLPRTLRFFSNIARGGCA